MLDTELHQLLAPYIDAPVECDGFARLAHTALTHAGIEHTCMIGRIKSEDGHRCTPTHLWLELEDGRVIDYRARMWLGNTDCVPNGVFHHSCYKSWAYDGQPIELPILSPVISKLLLLAIPLGHDSHQ